MSDSELHNKEHESEIEDDNDNLFGDGDEDEHDNDNDDIFGEEQSQTQNLDEDQDERLGPQDVNENVVQRLIQVSIPRYPTSHRTEENYLTRVPPFLQFEPHPFDSSKFLDQVTDEASNATSEEKSQLKLQRENTIRWKYSRNSKGNVVKESNARFIKWSDGSVSLQLGNEMFDVHEKDHQDTFLTISHPKNQILQSTSLLKKTMTFVPTSTSSQIHRQITQQLAKKQLKGSNVVGNIATTQDPETIKREAEKAEELRLKEQRKLEAKRRQMEEREGGLLPQGQRSTDVATQGYYEDYGDEEDEEEDEDDFVVNDEDGEEPEEDDEDDDIDKANRLSELKAQGAKRYEEREQQQQQEGSRKKRRIIDDEDDDDE